MARLASGKGRSLALIQQSVDQLGVGSSENSEGGTGKIEGFAKRLDVWQLGSMSEVINIMARRLHYMPHKEGKVADCKEAVRRCMGNTARSAANLAQSDVFIEQAIQHDPRLARRAKWHRTDDGEIGCPALIAAGDDAPYFKRNRCDVSEAGGGEPVRIVISTDANKVLPGTAAAFIAAVRLVQQWRSVEVWWQGAWLNPDRTAGWVFHVPLVQGDMDYTRLDYCISDESRDTISYAIMMTRACEVTKCLWNGCSTTANESHLGEYGESKFVSHTGIRPDGRSIAWCAASWLGWESEGMAEWRMKDSALQKIPVLVDHVTTDADRERWKRIADATRQSELEAAAKRAASMSRNF